MSAKISKRQQLTNALADLDNAAEVAMRDLHEGKDDATVITSLRWMRDCLNEVHYFASDFEDRGVFVAAAASAMSEMADYAHDYGMNLQQVQQRESISRYDFRQLMWLDGPCMRAAKVGYDKSAEIAALV